MRWSDCKKRERVAVPGGGGRARERETGEKEGKKEEELGALDTTCKVMGFFSGKEPCASSPRDASDMRVT